MKVNKYEIIMILVLILLEAISLGISYIWFDKLQLIWQFLVTLMNLLWLVLLYICIKRLNVSK